MQAPTAETSRRPSLVAKPWSETAASAALATSAAYSAHLDRDIRDPYGGWILVICIVAMVFGFLWGAFRLIRPRRA